MISFPPEALEKITLSLSHVFLGPWVSGFCSIDGEIFLSLLLVVISRAEALSTA